VGSSKAFTQTDCILFFIVRVQDFSGFGMRMANFVSRYDCTREVDHWNAGSQETLGADLRPYVLISTPQGAFNCQVLTAGSLLWCSMALHFYVLVNVAETLND
jgi:hypothetical protein